MRSWRACSARRNTDPSSRRGASPIWTLRGSGRNASCAGITTTIGTAASVTSARRSATRAWIDRSSQIVTRFTSRPASTIRAAGHDTRGTGRQSRSSRSIRSERPWPAPSQTECIRPVRPHDSGDDYLDARRSCPPAQGHHSRPDNANSNFLIQSTKTAADTSKVPGNPTGKTGSANEGTPSRATRGRRRPARRCPDVRRER